MKPLIKIEEEVVRKKVVDKKAIEEIALEIVKGNFKIESYTSERALFGEHTDTIDLVLNPSCTVTIETNHHGF